MERVERTEMRADNTASGAGGRAASMWELVEAEVSAARGSLERSVAAYNDAVEQFERVLDGWAMESWQKVEIPDEDEDADEIEKLAGDIQDPATTVEEIGGLAEKLARAGEAIEADAGALADAVREREGVVANSVEAVHAAMTRIGRYVEEVAESPSAEGLERLGNLERALDAVLRLMQG